jgi:ornithine cyclodeaminase/alanine dehydrogenase-like protein (mu-crystallin family)
MPASDTDTVTGLKVVTLPAGGGPPKGAINLFSPEGDLLGVLNAELITAFRTAVATMIPLVCHRLPDRANVLVFGAGKQAEWHIRLCLKLFGDKTDQVTVINRGKPGLEALRRNLDADLTPSFPKVSFAYHWKDSQELGEEGLQKVVSEADAVFCCTPSTQPLFSDSYLGGKGAKRRFLSLIGSYKPHMQEVDSETLLSGDNILVDSREACLAEAGELLMAGVTGGQLVEIGELPILEPEDWDKATETDRPNSSANTVFKCVGMGIMDLVIGREILRLGRDMGVGIEIESF